ncbi:hypothetical protein HK102_006955 [Quaeritorhiza haematococci]|nr:hypothetical protein HK102_006955 [Quaeritorhiza haematococci]
MTTVHEGSLYQQRADLQHNTSLMLTPRTHLIRQTASTSGFVYSMVIVVLSLEARNVAAQFRSKRTTDNSTIRAMENSAPSSLSTAKPDFQGIVLFEQFVIMVAITTIIIQGLYIYDVVAFPQILRYPAFRMPGLVVNVGFIVLQMFGEIEEFMREVMKRWPKLGGRSMCGTSGQGLNSEARLEDDSNKTKDIVLPSGAFYIREVPSSIMQTDASDETIAEMSQLAKDDTEQDQMPPTVSLALILVANFLFNVSFYIIIPTVADYSQSLGAGPVFGGLVIGGVTLTSAVTLFPLTPVSIPHPHWKTRERPRIYRLAVCEAVLHRSKDRGPSKANDLQCHAGNSSDARNGGGTIVGWDVVDPSPPTTAATNEGTAIQDEDSVEKGTLANQLGDSTSISAPDFPLDDLTTLPYSSKKVKFVIAAVMGFLAYVVFFELGAWEAIILIFGKAAFGWTEWDAGNFIGLIGLGSFILMLPLTVFARKI